MIKKRLAFRLRHFAAIALVGLAPRSFAEAPADKYWAQLEYFFPTISSTARVDVLSTGRPGTSVNLEDDLGLEDREGTPYLLLGARLGERWRLEFEYYELERDAVRTIDRSIDFGDVTFPVSAQVSSRFDTTIYRLTGGYSFYRTPKAEAGASLGLHVTDFRVALAGQGGGPGGFAFQNEQRDQLVPLPTLGLYGTFMLSDQWILRGRVDFLSLEYDNYDGSLTNWMVALGSRFAKHWGTGLGYRFVDYKLESKKPDLYGQFEYEFKGPTLYLEAVF